MTNRQTVQTPKGTFQVFSNGLQGGLYVASLLYHVRHAGNPNDETDLGTMEFKLQTEQGATEQQALEVLLQWCGQKLGGACRYQKE